MIKIDELERLLEEEKSLEFVSFNEDKALMLGLKILERAKLFGNVSIQIIKNDQLMFYYSMKDTSIDNYDWCNQKSNVVKRFSHSSLYIKEKYLKKQVKFNEYLNLDPKEYQAKGGSVPLLINGSGNIGSVTVSGLVDTADHQLVVDTIKEVIKEEVA